MASQFKLLEMIDTTVTPEHSVTIYANDRAQGAACAIAAGAATLHHNCFAPVQSRIGQTCAQASASHKVLLTSRRALRRYDRSDRMLCETLNSSKCFAITLAVDSLSLPGIDTASWFADSK